jgi:hypothetical protein
MDERVVRLRAAARAAGTSDGRPRCRDGAPADSSARSQQQRQAEPADSGSLGPAEEAADRRLNLPPLQRAELATTGQRSWPWRAHAASTQPVYVTPASSTAAARGGGLSEEMAWQRLYPLAQVVRLSIDIDSEIDGDMEVSRRALNVDS